MVMEIPTYVVEASALIDGIHEIKQWVYEGSARILIPICTYEQVETAWKATIAPKDVQKDAATPRSSGRTARKEQPLFDINPRATWEFLQRVKSEKGEDGVKFQQENEEFTQWREEDEKAAEKVETPPAAPTSFAEALLRKLNMKDDSESNGLKVAPKPRLVARSNEPKSPWKYHKVPIVTSHGLSAEMKPLFSSILWRLYECDNNPLMPEHYELFTGTNAMLAAAERLEIPVTTPLRVRSYLHEIKLENDHRLQSGELEANFPESFTLNNATNHTHVADPTTQAVNGDAIPGIPSESPESMEKDEKEQEEIGAEESLDVALRSEGTDQADNIPANGTNEDGALKSEDTSLSTVNVPKAEPMEDLVEDVGQSRQENESHAQIVALKSTIGGNELDPKSLSPSSSPSTANAEPKSKDSDPDSDEEIIVFNPRARRASGKKHKDGSRSRPTTSSGAAPKMLKTSPKESSVRPATSVGKTSTTEKDGTGPVTLTNDNDLLAEDSKVQAAAEKLKLKIGSTLKPESPIFTPGKPFIPTLQQPTSQLRYEAPADPASVSPPKSPVFLAKARSDTPRHPRAAMQQRQSSQEQIRLQRENQQRESEKMIQRQREAIQRRAKIEEKPPKKMAETVEQKPAEKPPPRQIQMEPTNNPTVIDPDAFDRSYIVQAPSSSPTTNSSGEKKRPRSHQPRGGATKRNQGSPKRNSKTPEPEVEFVLKSGAPRGSARGKGKLWVP